ncbi:MAG: helix-turn-helix transcriptional regulator [Lachnospiraceae bacterium]|nr:helix-turn-helix transcriptional regulator [Lachnospiraceae bacterium]
MENRIKQLREERHMTQIRLSIELEVSQEAVSGYESGKHYPSVAILLKMRELFHTNIDYILGLSDVRCTKNIETISPDEQLLLSKWNSLDERRKELLLAYIDGLTAIK